LKNTALRTILWSQIPSKESNSLLQSQEVTGGHIAGVSREIEAEEEEGEEEEEILLETAALTETDTMNLHLSMVTVHTCRINQGIGLQGVTNKWAGEAIVTDYLLEEVTYNLSVGTQMDTTTLDNTWQSRRTLHNITTPSNTNPSNNISTNTNNSANYLTICR